MGSKDTTTLQTSDTFDVENSISFSDKTVTPLDVSKLTKQDIQKLLSQNSNRVSLQVKDNARSKVWQRFKQINVDNQIVNFVKCVSCQAIYHHSTNTGTSVLKSHVCSDVANNIFRAARVT